MNQQKQNGNLIAIVAMCFLFAMISFVTNLAAPFGTIWKNQYAGANTLGMMGNMMNFLAYLFMGIPAGNMLVKIGYKKTSLTAMAVGFVGLLVQYLSSTFGAETEVFALGEYSIKMNFIIYLLGAFICGFRWCCQLTFCYADTALRRCIDRNRNSENCHDRRCAPALHRHGCIRCNLYHHFICKHSRTSPEKR